MKIIILAAGRGSRMQNNSIHKGLLPFRGKALISHIIDKYPGHEFVIAVHHLQQQLRDFISIAHPTQSIKFVDVGSIDTAVAGPGYSLLEALKVSADESLVVMCDTYFELPKLTSFDQNWLGVGEVPVEERISYCNLTVSNSFVAKVLDKRVSSETNCSWSGLMFIKDWKTVVNTLHEACHFEKELQCSHGWDHITLKAVEHAWVDLGTHDRYVRALRNEGYDYSKPDEITYVLEDKVIKFFGDYNRLVDRVSRQQHELHGVTPYLLTTRGNFVVWEKKDGLTFYKRGSLTLLKSFLEWMQSSVWTPRAIQGVIDAQTFYKSKTESRIKSYLESCSIDFESVNGIAMSKSWLQILEQINWSKFCDDTIITKFHGDLNFDNIIVTPQNTFCLIDWRDSFGEDKCFGDLYYEFAKLLSGLEFDFDLVKRGDTQIDVNHGNATISFVKRTINDEYKKIIISKAANMGLNLDKLQLLKILLLAGMSGVHKQPYSTALYFYSLYLFEANRQQFATFLIEV